MGPSRTHRAGRPHVRPFAAALTSVAIGLGALSAPVAGGAPGPSMVEDIRLGGASIPEELTAVGETLYFSANDGTRGRELWKSNGTQAGTKRVKDIRPGSGGSAPRGLTNVAGRLFFGANDGVHGRELWVSDGTGPGTQRLTDINPDSVNSQPFHLTALGDRLFFSVEHQASGRIELWKSNGTPAGTVRVKRFGAGEFIGGDPASFDGRLFFPLAHGTLAAEGLGLWTSDGTAAGTEHFFGTVGHWPGGLTPAGPRLFYVAGSDLYRTNGTPAGTKSMGDVEPSEFTLTNVGRTLFFSGFIDNENSADDGLWKSNGSVAGTILVKALSNPVFMTRVGSNLFLRNFAIGEPKALWFSDGSTDGTESLLEVDSGTRMDELTRVGGTLYLIVGNDLWRSDGTVSGTESVAPVPVAADLTNVAGTLYFTADDGTHGRELWRYMP